MNVLLDLDGTLTDPREGIVRCVRHAFAGLDEPCPSDGELERYIGPPLHVSFGAMFGVGSPKIARAIELYRERFTAVGLFENKLYAGIPETLKRLRELGATLTVATSKPMTQSMDPAATRMVGDREHDIRGAIANHISGIGVLWGYGSRQELLAAGAAAVCERPAGLCEVLSI